MCVHERASATRAARSRCSGTWGTIRRSTRLRRFCCGGCRARDGVTSRRTPARPSSSLCPCTSDIKTRQSGRESASSPVSFLFVQVSKNTKTRSVGESRLNERVVDFLPHLTAENADRAAFANSSLAKRVPRGARATTWGVHTIAYPPCRAALDQTNVQAHRHVFFVGKGHLTPTGRCDAWWRAPRDDRLKRAIRIAYSVNVLPAGVVSNENRTYDVLVQKASFFPIRATRRRKRVKLSKRGLEYSMAVRNLYRNVRV